MIVTYQSGEVPLIWDKVRPFIKAALDRGSNWTLGEVYEALRGARAQLWTWQDPDIQAAMVTTIQGDDCLILTIGGKNMRAWFQYLPALEAWAQERGCKRLKLHGRKGWSRWFSVDRVGEQIEMSRQL